MKGLSIEEIQSRMPGAVDGRFTDFLGERFYQIKNYDAMPAFFMTVVSSSDVWNYVWSNGGLTAGRINSDHALFPYYTADKVSDGRVTTGPATFIRGAGSQGTWLWEPFSENGRDAWSIERNLYKNANGSKLYFEEINRDLNLVFQYGWTSSERFGLVRHARLINRGNADVKLEILDGCRNVLPACVTSDFQNSNSVLLDAYKKTDIEADSLLAVFSVSSIVTDKAEPNEGLLANVGWFSCSDPVYADPETPGAFRTGKPLPATPVVKGLRPSLFVLRALDLPAAADTRATQHGSACKGACAEWYQVFDTDLDHNRIVALKRVLENRKNLAAEIAADVEACAQTLDSYIAAADGIQNTADEATCIHHRANVMFNIMRGGLPAEGDLVDTEDFRAFCRVRNRKHADTAAKITADLPGKVRYRSLLDAARRSGDPQTERLCLEYLPLTFSRRHGDPSRPWNRFSIELRDAKGNRKLNYQGNWRDIFQNWEALAWSWPVFLEGMTAKFLNATTADGYNPYRITRDGIDWEVVEPDNPWSNIGYWGDHQIIYLAKLLELRSKFDRKALLASLADIRFSSGNIPYRLKSHGEIVKNPRSTIDFDFDTHHRIEREEASYGTDARLMRDAKGEVALVSMTAKFISLVSAKMASYVPGGGIWLNTQRPEWNDANNALAGYGLSMVTLSYLRRFLVFLIELYRDAPQASFPVPAETAAFFRDLGKAFSAQDPDSLRNGKARREFVDRCGLLFEAARNSLYANGYAPNSVDIGKEELLGAFKAFLTHAESTIRANRREDGLYHAYNTLAVRGDGSMDVEYLNEMLEGQVAVLSSGQLNSGEALDLLNAMKKSDLWREDQYSYILYPNRELPRFCSKNSLPASEARRIPLLAAMLDAGDHSLVRIDEKGECHFNPAFRNAGVMDSAYSRLLEGGSPWADKAAASRDAVFGLYEKTFDHRSFTGRSGTFYAYEGLGSIYWHMVAKLLLAVQEYVLAEKDPLLREKLAQAYYDVRAGIGFNKTPDAYGAFPTDPYSHTPAGQGAKQPGMTGQVKEEVITRWGELGLTVADGILRIDPYLLREREFTPQGTLSFTWCGIPFTYRAVKPGEKPSIAVTGARGTVRREGTALTAEESQGIFYRDGSVSAVEAAVAIGNI